MRVINYPRQRPRQFIMLGVFVISFIASFLWTRWLLDAARAWGYSAKGAANIATMAFFGHLIGGAFFFIARAHWYRERSTEEHSFVKMNYPRATIADMKWLSDNCQPGTYTVHRTEGDWTREQARRDAPANHIEFHADHERVLFELARQRNGVPDFPSIRRVAH